jgi:hypothetical protein
MNKEQIIQETRNDIPSDLEIDGKDIDTVCEILTEQDYRRETRGECEYCKTDDEKCQTCTEFYKNTDDRCSGYDDGKCIKYTPVKYCFNCGAKMRGE